MADEHDILIDSAGHVRFVYSDLLDEVFAGHERTTYRASHVEPSENGKPGWVADMRPSGGRILFAPTIIGQTPPWNEALVLSDPHQIPFRTRAEALDAERAWLRKEKGL